MIAVVATVLYLVLAHGAILTGSTGMRMAAVAMLLGFLFLVLRPMPWLQLLAAALLVACLVWTPDPTQLLLMAAPVLFPLLIAGAIGRSLLPGRQPLIERIMWHMHGCPEQLDERHRTYARAVTVYWCVVLALLAAFNLGLAIHADPVTWSWFSNVAGYLVPVLAMLAEYGVRRLLFPKQHYRNLFDFITRLVRLTPVLAKDLACEWRREKRPDATTAVRS